jgi:hypothetical protein
MISEDQPGSPARPDRTHVHNLLLGPSHSSHARDHHPELPPGRLLPPADLGSRRRTPRAAICQSPRATGMRGSYARTPNRNSYRNSRHISACARRSSIPALGRRTRPRPRHDSFTVALGCRVEVLGEVGQLVELVTSWTRAGRPRWHRARPAVTWPSYNAG